MSNEEIIRIFYSAFQKKDYKTMQALYDDNATFTDEVFVNLNANEVRSMWRMLVSRARDLQLEFKNIQSYGEKCTAEWTATYTFSVTGKLVVNHIKAEFRIVNGKIVEHRDTFDFPKWAAQALGFKGKILGKTKMLRKRVQGNARAGLEKFIRSTYLR